MPKEDTDITRIIHNCFAFMTLLFAKTDRHYDRIDKTD